MRSAIIIGSKGFIGKHLKKYLLDIHINVWEADIVVDYTAGPNYFLVDSVNSNYYDIFSFQKFDFCINCSGAASVPDSIKNPARDYNLNTHNVFKLLDAIRIHQPECKFINISSAAVYGNPTSLPIGEESHLRPLSPYGYHKYMSEQLCSMYHSLYGIATCSLRVFSAYGEGLCKQLFWDIFQKAAKGNHITLFGTGNESRDFIYIGDLVRLIVIITEKASFKGEAVNVGNGYEVTISEAVSTFLSFFESPITYGFSGETREGDPTRWLADNSLIKSFGYSQRYSIAEGLNNYYQWIIQRKD